MSLKQVETFLKRLCRYHLTGGCKNNSECEFSHIFVLSDFGSDLRKTLKNILEPKAKQGSESSKQLAVVPKAGSGSSEVVLLKKQLDQLQNDLKQKEQLGALEKRLEQLQLREQLRELEESNKSVVKGVKKELRQEAALREVKQQNQLNHFKLKQKVKDNRLTIIFIIV